MRSAVARETVLSSLLLVKVSHSRRHHPTPQRTCSTEAEDALIAAAIAQQVSDASACEQAAPKRLSKPHHWDAGADVITSLISLNGGAHEANPLVLGATHPAPLLLRPWLPRKCDLNKVSKRHPRLATTLAYVQIAVDRGIDSEWLPYAGSGCVGSGFPLRTRELKDLLYPASLLSALDSEMQLPDESISGERRLVAALHGTGSA